MKKTILIVVVLSLVSGGFSYWGEGQAFAASTFAEEEPGPALAGGTKSFWGAITKQLGKIEILAVALKNVVQGVGEVVSRINPFGAGSLVNPPETTEPEEMNEVEPPLIEGELGLGPESEPDPSLDEIQEDLDDILEEFDVISEDTSEIFPEEPVEELIEVEPQLIEESEPELEIEPEPDPEPELEPEPEPELEPEPEPELEPESAEAEPSLIEEGSSQTCKWQGDAPKRFRALINEVAWMGTDDSPDDEWIELKNIWGVPINLSGWQLLDKDGQIEVIFGEEDIIPAGGYYLLERTDDDSMPDASADFIYTGALNDTDEALYLFDNNCRLEDKIEANPNWPAGDKIGKKSMERFDILYWYTGSGTPGNENSPAPAIYSNPSGSAPAPEALSSSDEEDEGDEEDGEEGGEAGEPASVVINEVAWMGTEADSHDEWIELYNNTEEDIDLTNWVLKSGDDTPNIVFSTTTSATTTIPAQGFYLLERFDDDTVKDVSADLIYGIDGSSWALENNGEKLELQDSEGNLIDKVGCEEKPNGNCKNWFAGKNNTKQTMERIDSQASSSDSNNWANNNLITKNGLDAEDNPINGTPKAENSVAKSFTEVSGGWTFDEDFTLAYLGSPYIVEGSIMVGSEAKLTIEPGVVIKFKYDPDLKTEFKVEGKLEAVGEDDQKIVFTSYYDDEFGGDTNGDGADTQPAPGDWNWFYFLNSPNSDLEKVIIRYGGRLEGDPPYTRGIVQIDGGDVDIKNSLIEKSKTLGVWLKNSSGSLIDGVEFKEIDTSYSKPAAVYIENDDPTVKNCIFEDNKIGVLVENFAEPTIKNNTFEGNHIPIKISTLLPSLSNNTAEDNDYNGIYLTSLSFPEGKTSMAWKKVGLPYIVENLDLSAGLELTIKPGVIIKLLDNKRINIDGTLKAKGNGNNKVVFTSISDDEYGGDTNNDESGTQPSAGNWDFINFSASSSDSVLDHVIVRYGGWYDDEDAKSGAIKADGTDLTIKNSFFEDNLYAGLELVDSDSEIKKTVFQGHRAEGDSSGLLIKDSEPDFTKTTFNNNYYGIYIESGDSPDLSGVTFGTGDDANDFDIYPEE